jgi:hypothetical protein
MRGGWTAGTSGFVLSMGAKGPWDAQPDNTAKPKANNHTRHEANIPKFMPITF